MTATIERAEAVERGAMMRDAGILRASEKKQNRDSAGLLRAEQRFLDVLLMNGSASSDDAADDLNAKHEDGGHWLGGIFLRLSRCGLIVESGSARSCRPIRHRGKLTLWSIGQREAVERRRRDVAAMLDALEASRNDAGESAVTDSPANPNLNHPLNGDATNEHNQAD